MTALNHFTDPISSPYTPVHTKYDPPEPPHTPHILPPEPPHILTPMMMMMMMMIISLFGQLGLWAPSSGV
jgi:hypothetical protein